MPFKKKINLFICSQQENTFEKILIIMKEASDTKSCNTYPKEMMKNTSNQVQIISLHIFFSFLVG